MTQPDRLNVFEIERGLLGAIMTSDEAYRDLLTLCDEIGPRFAGSPAEREAARFIKRRMESDGLENVHLEEFTYTGWQRGPTSLEIVRPWSRCLNSISLPYSPQADVTGPVVSVGEGEAEDFALLGEGLRGKVVLCQAESTPKAGRKSSHRRDKYLRAVGVGALAFLYVSQNPGQHLITGGLPLDVPSTVPAAAVSFEDGRLIERALDRGEVTMRLRVECVQQPVVSYNVVGEVPGRDPSRLVAIGAHYDSHDNAPGAQDDAAGTVVALAVGRALAPLKGRLAATVRVVHFAAEEIGLLGSWEYARRHRAELGEARFMLNLDSCADGQPGTEVLRLMGCPDLEPHFAAMARDLKYPLGVKREHAVHTDHFPVLAAGAPVGWLRSVQTGALVGRGWGHTASDTVDKVNPLSLQLLAMLAARILVRIGEDDEWPGTRRTAEQVLEVARAEDERLVETLRSGGFL